MEISIGGHCPVCSYDKLFIINSSLDKLAFQCCPNCTFAYNKLGQLDFFEIIMQLMYRLSVSAAKSEIEQAGVYPEEDRDRDRDPYYSLLRDFTSMYQEQFSSLTPNFQRLHLMTISLNAERKMENNICEPPRHIVTRFKSSNPPLLNK